MITTILFDNDGVLVDTERLYMQATREVLATVGVDLTVELYISHSLTRGLNTMALAAASGATATEVEVLRAKRNARYAELLHQTHCVIDGSDAAVAARPLPHGRRHRFAARPLRNHSSEERPAEVF
jgi:beta-phosphoglucomutase-like phosphatase (HAD superfamily)